MEYILNIDGENIPVETNIRWVCHNTLRIAEETTTPERKTKPLPTKPQNKEGGITKTELENKLAESMLFMDSEIQAILNLVGSYTIGNAITACEALGIKLFGNDIDILIGTLL